MNKLNNSRVIVFGIGGVGGYVAEALVRGGIGSIDIVDNDKIYASNLNRQILATHSTLNKYKVDVAEERVHDINPNCKVVKHNFFYLAETAKQINLSEYDYIIDAIDTVSSKIEIIKNAKKLNVPVISCMGTANKMDPSKLEVSDIYQTSVCPLAKVIRKLCKENEITNLKVVYSKELSSLFNLEDKTVLGSNSFVPATAGLLLASIVLKELSGLL